MEERGEKLQEATLEDISRAASTAVDTVFKFDFTISTEDAKTSTNKRIRKRSKKRRDNKKKNGLKKKSENATQREKPAQQRGGTDDYSLSMPKKQMSTNGMLDKTIGSSSILKLRKATETDSEMTKMHLRYGQGRRNLAAIQQREQRKKGVYTTEAKASSHFKFNFVATP